MRHAVCVQMSHAVPYVHRIGQRCVDAQGLCVAAVEQAIKAAS